jgi:deazaflavin-dependent oxidoreductase (nitroreductase family)
VFKPDFSTRNWIGDHLKAYLEDGESARLIDMTAAGGPAETPTLVLRTKGRKSGRTLLSPLIYGEAGDEKVLIASKGGAPEHPAWFLNLEAEPQVEYKLGDECWRAVARIVEGPEREQLWRMMAEVYPPYDEYQARTDRHIPLIALKPVERIEKLSD